MRKKESCKTGRISLDSRLFLTIDHTLSLPYTVWSVWSQQSAQVLLSMLFDAVYTVCMGGKVTTLRSRMLLPHWLMALPLYCRTETDGTEQFCMIRAISGHLRSKRFTETKAQQSYIPLFKEGELHLIYLTVNLIFLQCATCWIMG